jgi:hypothetical protein
MPWAASAAIDALPEVERGQITPAIDDVPELESRDLALRCEARPRYRALTPAEAQCLAADESPLGTLLSDERAALRDSPGLCHGNERAVAVMRRALTHAAAEARNASAGDALKAYYHLVEAEGLHDLALDSRQTLGTALAELDTLRQRGITIPPTAGEVERQQIELDQQTVAGELAILQLNNALRELTGLRSGDDTQRFWPVAELKVVAEPIDLDAAVTEGLQWRPELNLLRYVERQLDRETLPVARQVLSGVTGILGSQPPTKRCSLTPLAFILCGSQGDADELVARRRQLHQYRRDREQAVAAEIRQAVYTVEARLKQVAVAKRRLTAMRQQATDAAERQQAARGNFVEVAVAELTAIQAQADLLSAVVAWELARVELREAQGMLIFECRGAACP